MNLGVWNSHAPEHIGLSMKHIVRPQVAYAAVSVMLTLSYGFSQSRVVVRVSNTVLRRSQLYKYMHEDEEFIIYIYIRIRFLVSADFCIFVSSST